MICWLTLTLTHGQRQRIICYEEKLSEESSGADTSLQCLCRFSCRWMRNYSAEVNTASQRGHMEKNNKPTSINSHASGVRWVPRKPSDLEHKHVRKYCKLHFGGYQRSEGHRCWGIHQCQFELWRKERVAVKSWKKPASMLFGGKKDVVDLPLTAFGKGWVKHLGTLQLMTGRWHTSRRPWAVTNWHQLR